MQSNLVLTHLPAAGLSALRPYLRQSALAAGQIVYEAGDAVETVFFPIDTVLAVLTVMRDGEAVETATVGNEGVVGVVAALAEGRTYTRIIVQSAGRVAQLPAVRLRQLVRERPDLLKLLLAHVNRNIAQAEQSAACNALHNTRERLARWLLLFQDRVGSPVVVLTQEYLAMVLGVQRTTVTITAQSLRSSGAISYRRGRIEILDRRLLEQAACECYAASKTVEPDPPEPVRAVG